ncbi:uncharacterized protein LOC141898848 [Tubulanus polymorphus]|uniref:uncharacterized protein LOC141898848 n=1 Tax=Tubulanus polymorphus TaxID=672921 RepID=UPI003DA675F2
MTFGDRYGRGRQQRQRKQTHITTRNSSKMSTTDTSKDMSSSRAEHNDASLIFPQSRWVPLIIFAVTVAIRLNIAADKENMWILHPDEVFQSVEIAHSEVYGYGFRAYEYLPPPGNSSIVESQEASYGMYSMRSFLLPRIYMILFHLKDFLHSQMKPFMFAKVFHATVASLLPVSVFRLATTISNCNDVAVIAAILVSFSLHLTTLGTHTLVNSLLAPFVFMVLEVIVRHFRSRESVVSRKAEANEEDINKNVRDKIVTKNDTSKPKNHKIHYHEYLELMSSGLMLGVLCYMRVDLILFFAFSITLFVLPFQNLHRAIRLSALVAVGFGLAILFCGFDDRWSYGKWFISPVQWLGFNVFRDLATNLFGWNDSQFYIRHIFVYDTTMTLLTCFSLCSLIVVLVAFVLPGNKLEKKLFTTFRLFCLVVILLIFYTNKGHKEIRFLHNGIVVFLMLVAVQIEFMMNLAMKHLTNLSKYLLYGLLIIYSVDCHLHLPSPKNKSNYGWVYGGIWDSNGINICVDYVGSQNDVTGIFLDRTYHMTGAYSLLHKDVSWFTLIHYEFNEFDKNSRVKLPSVNFLTSTDTVHVSVLNRISEYITLHNSPLVLKHLINNPQYNYLILSRKRKIINIGFEEVFSYGTMKVLRRSTDPSVNLQLQNIAKMIPLGRNATILEYEGSWLKTLGKPKKAIERLKLAIDLDPNRIRAYQLLKYIYNDLHDRKSATDIHNKCAKLHGHSICNKLQPRTILHKDYDILK